MIRLDCEACRDYLKALDDIQAEIDRLECRGDPREVDLLGHAREERGSVEVRYLEHRSLHEPSHQEVRQ